jgi:hypothetical protein
MKKFITAFILLATFISNAQEYNTYLLKKEELKGKDKGKYYLKSNESIVGDLSYDKLNSIYLWNSTNPPEYEKDERVGVYIDKLDAAKANLSLFDTAGIIFNSYANKRVGFGKLHSFGKFTLPPVYTNFTFVNGNAIYGQKLKNGNWKGASASYNTDIKKYEYILLPENKDYTLLSPNLILFKDINNKYGLMDSYGNILADAEYDTCMPVFKYHSYDITKAKVQSQSWIKDKPVSLQKNFVTPNSYLAPNLLQNSEKLPVFLLKNKEYTILASAKYITKPIKNAVISSHSLPGPNQSYFYFIHFNQQEYDIISWYGIKPEQKYKYAYLETIKRDSTPGLDSKWNFTDKEDYSEPFRAYSVDSLNQVKYKKEYDDAQKLKAEKADYILKVEASPDNYTTVMKGTYENIKWEEAYKTYSTAGGGYDELMSVKTEDMNIIRLSIYFTAKASQYDSEIHKFELTATMAIEPTVIKGKGFGIDSKDVDGYRLFQRLAKTDEKPDVDKFKNEMNAKGKKAELDLKSISGTYNPITREIQFTVEKTFGGTILITAKRTQK